MTASSQRRARPARLSRRLALARLALVWEDAAERAWRGVSLIALFLGLVLLGLWTWLPPVLHVLCLLAFAVLVPLVLWRDFRGHAWPRDSDVLRRVEKKSGLDHRPLAALDDEFAGDRADGASRALFELHRRRMAERLRRVKAGWPRSDVVSSDRLALRFLALLVFAWGAVAGWPQARAHFTALLEPEFSAAGGAETGELTLWITPPAYTGIAPIWFSREDGQEGPLPVPGGSELVAQVRGGQAAPVLAVDGSRTVFREAGAGGWEVSYVLEGGSRFTISQAGTVIAGRAITVIADRPPEVALTDEPSETLRTTLRLDVAARDDYGLKDIRAEMRRTGGDPGDVLRVSVPLERTGVAAMSGPSFFNLMAHPWAGLEVELVLVATDVIGQETASGPRTVELPERFFHHPVAREIADQRKVFVSDRSLAAETASLLGGLSRDPQAYLGDVAVHLGLVTAARRLDYSAGDERTPAAVTALMWETALAVEEGPLAFAEQRVRDLQQQLLTALAEGASDEEIERLLAELHHAMDEYMRALSSRLRSDPGQLFDPTEALKAVGSRELTDLVDRIAELVRSGSRRQAHSLLTRLQEIMENISVGNLSDLSGSSSAEAVEMIQTIRQIITDQQVLLDESFRILREQGEGGIDTAPQAERQAGIRSVLQAFMERIELFGYDAPRQYSRADRSMGRAARQLGAGRPGHAVDHQTAAIDFLRKGADDMMSQILELLGESVAGDNQGFFSAPRDPVGRALGGTAGIDTSGMDIPDRGALVRARQILDELNRRAAEQYRPEDERNYLLRLLRRF